MEFDPSKKVVSHLQRAKLDLSNFQETINMTDLQLGQESSVRRQTIMYVSVSIPTVLVHSSLATD